MQVYVRPKPPLGFPTERWETTREAAERIIEAEIKKLKRKKSGSVKARSKSPRPGLSKKKKIFPEMWKDYKALFAYSQFGKCGFCEGLILVVDDGDVEHYRPKSAISNLPATFGRQRQASASIKNRVPVCISTTGYYWLAYDWSNYLLACSKCNGLKSTVFPVKNNPRAINPLKTGPLEQALLLNPFDRKIPARHLKFLEDGFVLGKTIYGRATIDTCGLYREELRAARQKIAIRAFDLARDLRQPSSKRRDPKLLSDCYDRGADDAPHCGMVRSIFEEVAQISWEEVVRQRATELALRSKQTKDPEEKKRIDESLEKMGRPNYKHAAAVRQIFKKTCKVAWDKLISRHAYQLARDFRACRKNWSKDAKYKLNWQKKFYDLAIANVSHLAVVRKAFEKESKMDWNELKAEVEAGFEFLWKLPADKGS